MFADVLVLGLDISHVGHVQKLMRFVSAQAASCCAHGDLDGTPYENSGNPWADAHQMSSTARVS